MRRLAVLAVVTACGPPPASDPPAPPVAAEPAPAPAATAPATDPALAPLAARAVHDDAFARAILYTWTTAEQAAALRRSRRLLVAGADQGEPSPFVRALRRLAARGDADAALLLDHPGLARRRYAWPSPFATVLGLGARRYGDVLVRIELDRGAVLALFRPAAAAPFAFVDMSGRPVDPADARADPGRIAAVYHVRDGPDDEIAFREYVVINESRVAAWSLSTPELDADVDAELAVIEQLRTGPFGHLPRDAVVAPAAPAWAAAPARPTALDRWHAALAFDNLRYRPTPGNLADIVAALRARDRAGPPLTVRPDMPFQTLSQGQQSPHAGR